MPLEKKKARLEEASAEQEDSSGLMSVTQSEFTLSVFDKMVSLPIELCSHIFAYFNWKRLLFLYSQISFYLIHKKGDYEKGKNKRKYEFYGNLRDEIRKILFDCLVELLPQNNDQIFSFLAKGERHNPFFLTKIVNAIFSQFDDNVFSYFLSPQTQSVADMRVLLRDFNEGQVCDSQKITVKQLIKACRDGSSIIDANDKENVVQAWRAEIANFNDLSDVEKNRSHYSVTLVDFFMRALLVKGPDDLSRSFNPLFLKHGYYEVDYGRGHYENVLVAFFSPKDLILFTNPANRPAVFEAIQSIVSAQDDRVSSAAKIQRIVAIISTVSWFYSEYQMVDLIDQLKRGGAFHNLQVYKCLIDPIYWRVFFILPISKNLKDKLINLFGSFSKNYFLATLGGFYNFLILDDVTIDKPIKENAVGDLDIIATMQDLMPATIVALFFQNCSVFDAVSAFLVRCLELQGEKKQRQSLSVVRSWFEKLKQYVRLFVYSIYWEEKSLSVVLCKLLAIFTDYSSIHKLANLLERDELIFGMFFSIVDDLCQDTKTAVKELQGVSNDPVFMQNIEMGSPDARRLFLSLINAFIVERRESILFLAMTAPGFDPENLLTMLKPSYFEKLCFLSSSESPSHEGVLTPPLEVWIRKVIEYFVGKFNAEDASKSYLKIAGVLVSHLLRQFSDDEKFDFLDTVVNMLISSSLKALKIFYFERCFEVDHPGYQVDFFQWMSSLFKVQNTADFFWKQAGLMCFILNNIKDTAIDFNNLHDCKVYKQNYFRNFFVNLIEHWLNDEAIKNPDCVLLAASIVFVHLKWVEHYYPEEFNKILRSKKIMGALKCIIKKFEKNQAKEKTIVCALLSIFTLRKNDSQWAMWSKESDCQEERKFLEYFTGIISEKSESSESMLTEEISEEGVRVLIESERKKFLEEPPQPAELFPEEESFAEEREPFAAYLSDQHMSIEVAASLLSEDSSPSLEACENQTFVVSSASALSSTSAPRFFPVPQPAVLTPQVTPPVLLPEGFYPTTLGLLFFNNGCYNLSLKSSSGRTAVYLSAGYYQRAGGAPSIWLNAAYYVFQPVQLQPALPMLPGAIVQQGYFTPPLPQLPSSAARVSRLD